MRVLATEDVWIKAVMKDDLRPFVTGEVVWIKPNTERPTQGPNWWLLSTEEPGWLCNVGEELLKQVVRRTLKAGQPIQATGQDLIAVKATFIKKWKALKKFNLATLWKQFRYDGDTNLKLAVLRVVKGDTLLLNYTGKYWYITTPQLGYENKVKIRVDTAQRIRDNSKFVKDILI